MVFIATFNNISVISWRKYEKSIDLSHVTDKLYHIMLYQYTSPLAGFELTTLVMLGTYCTGSCKSNNQKTTTAPMMGVTCTLLYSYLSVLTLKKYS